MPTIPGISRGREDCIFLLYLLRSRLGICSPLEANWRSILKGRDARDSQKFTCIKQQHYVPSVTSHAFGAEMERGTKFLGWFDVDLTLYDPWGTWGVCLGEISHLWLRKAKTAAIRYSKVNADWNSDCSVVNAGRISAKDGVPPWW